MHGEKATRPCSGCGAVLTRLVSQARGARWFCTTSCQQRAAPTGKSVGRTLNPLRGQKETRPCEVCDVPVTRYLSQTKLAQAWTCSRRCLGKLMVARRQATGTWKTGQKKRRGETNLCETCGKPVYRNASQAAKGEGRFCSKTCVDAAHVKAPAVKQCGICGTEMQLKPSQAARQFCSRFCMGLGKIARPLNRMHNGKPARLDSDGYVWIWEPSHPNTSSKGWQPEHRMVVERIIGRYLTSDEHVDHKNTRKDDNDPSNLQVLSPSAHSVKTWQDRVGDLAEYRRLYGPLP